MNKKTGNSPTDKTKKKKKRFMPGSLTSNRRVPVDQPPKVIQSLVRHDPRPDFVAQQHERSLRRRTTWYDLHKEDFRTLTVKQKSFLKAYTEELTIHGALHVTGMHPTAHYTSMKVNPIYKRLFDDLREYVVEALEGEGFRRAYHGVKEYVYFQGNICGEKQIFSDTLLMFLLRAANPDKYRERSTMDLNVKPQDGDLDPALRSVSRDTLRKIRLLVEEDQRKALIIEQEKTA